MMKRTGKRILSVLTAALFVCSMPFAVLAGDGDGHTHVYSDVTVVAPGYVRAGYTIYRCACGDSYIDDRVAPLEQPICVMTDGQIMPGGTFTVQARLLHCSGLEDLALDMDYNENWLCLTTVECAEYGTPTILSEKALYFETIDPTVQEAVLLLTFDVHANAPSGVQEISMSGCGVSGCAVDKGEQISLTAQNAKLNIYRPTKLTVTAPDGPINVGDTVQMTVDLSNNAGLAGMVFELHYDPQILTLTDVQESGLFAEGSFVTSGDPAIMPLRILWDDAAAMEPHYEVGTLLTLTFHVKDTAQAGTTNVWLTFDSDDMLNMQLEPVEVLTSGASLTLVRRIAGDVNGDDTLDLRDVTCLSRYLAGGWDVEIDARNSDVNGDNVIDLKDVVLIRRSLAGGWEVELV